MNPRIVLAGIGLASAIVVVGQINVDAQFRKGSSFKSTADRSGDPLGGVIGPDVMVWNIYDYANWGVIGDIRAYSFGMISCNIGDQELSWRDNGAFANQHPVIGANMFRLKDGKFEHIGQTWLKHGFCALDGNACGNCQSNGSCDWLGINCSDPYSASLNGSQGYLGPKYQVNAYTGEFAWPHDYPGGGTINGRLQVHLNDVDPIQNQGATYFAEGHYVTPDDALWGNGYNNVSYRGINIGGSGQVAGWAGNTIMQTPAIYAWQNVDPSVTIKEFDVPNDGRMFLGYKVTDLKNGYWAYEYALYNMNSDRSAGTFNIPVSESVDIINVGFHDVDYHSGEPFVDTDWKSSRNSSEMTWQSQPFDENTNANAVRWGTIYNFRFEADSPPTSKGIDIGLYKPGSPELVTVMAVGPESPTCAEDLTGDGFVSTADLLELFTQWGTAGAADFNGDGDVDTDDLIHLLSSWGPCP